MKNLDDAHGADATFGFCALAGSEGKAEGFWGVSLGLADLGGRFGIMDLNLVNFNTSSLKRKISNPALDEPDQLMVGIG